ncbi:Serine-threonine/tyrosine-protein kinase, catalytic domain [Sesbania bispinosa]|nr:Serine-threonine/tyrosine-protein kinase, catalytic domain [Sesbania bispinosa]
MKTGVVLALILQLVKFCIIGFAVEAQGPEAFLLVVHPRGEAPGPIHHGQSWGSSASSPSEPNGFAISPSPATFPVDPSPSEAPGLLQPNGSFLHPPVTLPPPTSAPTPQKIKGIEPSISPSPSIKTLSPPYNAVPTPSTTERNVPPSIQPSPPQKKAPSVRPPVPTPTAPAPVAVPSGNFPRISPVSHPIEHGSLPPMIDKRNETKNHNLQPVSPAPIATPSTNFPKISPVSHPTENGSLPPNAHREGTNKGQTPEPISPAPVFNLPKHFPVSQPTEHGSLPPTVHRRNSSTGHTLDPVSQAPVAIPPAILPKSSPVSQPIQNASFSPNVHNGTANKHHTHTPEPVMASPVTSPTSPFPVDPPLVHPVIPAASPSKSPAPIISPALTPSRRFNWTKGGQPASAPSYRTPKPQSKPLPAIVHSPAQAPAVHKENHPPASSPSTTVYKHHHTRNTITSPAPASSYLVSPPSSTHQDKPIPPSLLPTSGRRHHAPPPINTGSSVSPFAFPIQSPVSQVSPAPSPSFKISPHPTKIPFHPPKVSPYRPTSKSPKKPTFPEVQALPPPPPNEDCLSTVCSEPYTNSPPGSPCRCVWPMKVGLRLSVSLYTFFPLVSELASEIATGVFMRQSQVRIMGANAASQQPDKTIALIDLVPLGEEFDKTTAFSTSERFWHKQVVIKASYFGDYDVLYVNYPGLPPSPPLPPSSINMVDGGPYSVGGNNGRTIKPLGVDIQKRQHKGGLSKGVIAIIALSVFLAIVLCSAAALTVFKCRDHVSQQTSTPRVLPSLSKAHGTAGSLVGGVLASASSSFRSSIAAYTGSAKTFSMNEIEKATDNFHPSRILGEGGFGLVYSGSLEDGTKVAVKVLKREDHHGDREFLSEVEMLSRLHHRNLVKLIGTDVPFDSVAKVAAIASMCVQPEVSDRPFMGEVVQALKLVCNECDEAKEAGSRSSSQEDLSVDLNNVSGQLTDNFQGQFSATHYDSGVDIENGLSASELFSSSARLGRQVSGSFRIHSYSGPLRTGRSRRLWQIIRKLSGGSVSEHGTMFKL